jgi:transcriptional regulator with XRE-family HTH domain
VPTSPPVTSTTSTTAGSASLTPGRRAHERTSAFGVGRVQQRIGRVGEVLFDGPGGTTASSWVCDTLEGMISHDARAWPAWRLIRDARGAAGLSQRALAERAGTSQPAIARYEAGQTLPDIDTLARLLHACGRRLELRATPLDPDERRQLAESLASSPQRRSARNRRMTALAAKGARARRAGRVRPLREP